MLLATLLLPVLTGAPAAAEPAPVHDPRRFDISYAAQPAEPASYGPQVRDDWDRTVLVRPVMPWYVGLHGGFTTTRTSRDQDVEVDFDDGYLLGLALGRRFSQPSQQAASWAAELELTWSDQDADRTGPGPINLQGSDFTVFALYLNGLFDFLFTERFGAYGGAGIGAAWTDFGGFVDDPSEFRDDSGPHLTWQLKAGIQWLLGERATVRLGYRFLNIDDIELDESAGDASFDLETTQHVIELGILFGF